MDISLIDKFDFNKNTLLINDVELNSLNDAIEYLRKINGTKFKLLIRPKNFKIIDGGNVFNKGPENIIDNTIYKVVVKKYMTLKATPEFNLNDKWNNNNPMPYVKMTGRVIKETKGMRLMELWGEIQLGNNITCMKCGRELTHPISIYLGIGPECSGMGYSNELTEAEEQALIDKVKNEVTSVKGQWWIPKSAFKTFEAINND